MSPSATTDSTPETPSKAPVLASGNPEDALPDDAPHAPPVFEDKYEERKYLKHRLAIAFRIFGKFGYCENVAGHITVRDPVKPDCFWVNPFGMHFSLIEDSDLILVDHSGKVIDGGRNRLLNYAAFAIHSQIHAARPDVLCAAHAHTPYGKAFSSTSRTLKMLTQDFCVFHNDLVLYPNFAGVVLATEEGASIARCLGSKKAAILGNHGLLVVGKTIEETVGWFVSLERCCMVQLAAEGCLREGGGVREGGKGGGNGEGEGEGLVEIGEVEAGTTWEAIGKSESGYFGGLPLFQIGEREFGERTYLGRGVEPL